MKRRALMQSRLMPSTSEEWAPKRHPSRELFTDFSFSDCHAKRNGGYFSFRSLQEVGADPLKKKGKFPSCRLPVGRFRSALGFEGSGGSLPHLVATGGGMKWEKGWAHRGGWNTYTNTHAQRGTHATLPPPLVVLTLLHKSVALEGVKGAFARLQWSW